MCEDVPTPFSRALHWELLVWVRDREVEAGEAAWSALFQDIVRAAACDHFAWGKQAGLWDTREEARYFFLDALMSPSFGSRHPLQVAWDTREQGGDARRCLLMLCRQAVRDATKPGSPRSTLKDKVSKTLKESPEFCRITSDGQVGYAWRHASTAAAPNSQPAWVALHPHKWAARLGPRTGSSRHKGFGVPLPNPNEIRALVKEVLCEIQGGVLLDELITLVLDVYRVPANQSVVSLNRGGPGGDEEDSGLDVADPDAEIPGERDTGQPDSKIAAYILLSIRKRAFPEPRELEAMQRRLESDDPGLIGELCPQGRNQERRMKYFIRVFLWLGELTDEMKELDHAAYQRLSGMQSSTFSDWRKQSEPWIREVLMQVDGAVDVGAWVSALQFLRKRFLSEKPDFIKLFPFGKESGSTEPAI